MKGWIHAHARDVGVEWVGGWVGGHSCQHPDALQATVASSAKCVLLATAASAHHRAPSSSSQQQPLLQAAALGTQHRVNAAPPAISLKSTPCPTVDFCSPTKSGAAASNVRQTPRNRCQRPVPGNGQHQPAPHTRQQAAASTCGRAANSNARHPAPQHSQRQPVPSVRRPPAA